MSDTDPISLEQRAKDLKVAAQSSHDGIYLTGPNRIELLPDELPGSSFEGDNFLLASFGNCRCASDAKAIRQFDAHARVPSGVSQVALGHETLQLILDAPADSSFDRGDVVVITPGHASEPIDPLTFESEKDGVLAALGYSYRYLGGLRRFNTVPAKAPAFVKAQGFGNLFNKVTPKPDTSLISLAHAEPFACNFGTNKHVFTIGENGDFKRAAREGLRVQSGKTWISKRSAKGVLHDIFNQGASGGQGAHTTPQARALVQADESRPTSA